MGIARAVPVVAYLARPRIEYVQSLVDGTGPDLATPIDQEGAHRVTGQRGSLPGIVFEALELVSAAIPTLDAAAVGRQPEIAAAVLGDGPDIVARQAGAGTALTV